MLTQRRGKFRQIKAASGLRSALDWIWFRRPFSDCDFLRPHTHARQGVLISNPLPSCGAKFGQLFSCSSSLLTSVLSNDLMDQTYTKAITRFQDKMASCDGDQIPSRTILTLSAFHIGKGVALGAQATVPVYIDALPSQIAEMITILNQTSSEVANNELSNSNNSSNLDSLQFDRYRSFSASDYDTVHFGSDLVREEDENMWNGSPNLVIVD
jgi:hypothetical protein